ncbi:MAG: hypothetical protein JEY71_13365 [Sphaerochaeta sp.]|nr:hypothetical protein [Sphaerochaeta sp.]
MYRYRKKGKRTFCFKGVPKNQTALSYSAEALQRVRRKRGSAYRLESGGPECLTDVSAQGLKLQGTSINSYNGLYKFFLKVVLNLPVKKKEASNVQILSISRKP